MGVWWDEATKLEFASQNGGAWVGGPFRGVIHTTEDSRTRPPPPATTVITIRRISRW